MNNKKNSKQNSDLDFVSSSSFQRSIKKTKWKQIILYALISIVTMVVFIALIHLGSQLLIDKKIEKDTIQQSSSLNGEPVKGAGITSKSTRYYHNTFSVLGETTFYKRIGNRQIVWDTETKKYPAIGNVKILDRGSGMTELNQMDADANRVIRYNQLNNERIIDFYYPSISYNFLPQELNIAVGLNDNTLIEVALSFSEPIQLNELGEVLGFKNVDWLWMNTQTKEQMDKLEAMPTGDSMKVKNGDNAKGFGVSEESRYSDTPMEDTKISGAIISGTPEELERFLNLGIIRASVIGVTIDKY